MWHNSKTQIVTKLKKTEIATKLETQIVTKLKKSEFWQKKISNIDKTKQNQTVTKLKKKLNCGKTQELKLW